MNCVTSQQMIRAYLDGYLSDRELEEFLNHVQTCPDCFDELEVYFSVYRTLRDVDEKGDYNFRKKLRRKLEESRAYLRRRNQSKALKVSLILAAEFALVMAFWGLINYDDGFLNRPKTHVVVETETEARTQQTEKITDRETDTETAIEADRETDKETENYE